jgi:hypothetical protein
VRAATTEKKGDRLLFDLEQERNGESVRASDF